MEAPFDVCWQIWPAVQDAGRTGKHPERLLPDALIRATLRDDADAKNTKE